MAAMRDKSNHRNNNIALPRHSCDGRGARCDALDLAFLARAVGACDGSVPWNKPEDILLIDTLPWKHDGTLDDNYTCSDLHG